MRDALERLMLLDLIDPARLKALVERQIPALEVFALLGGQPLDLEAVRARLAGWTDEADGPDPRPAGGSASDYLGAVEALADPATRVVPDAQPAGYSDTPDTQTYVGPHRLFYPGDDAPGVWDRDEVGRMNTSVTDDTAADKLGDLTDTGLKWRERLVTADPEAWLSGRVGLASTGEAYADWVEVDERARAAHQTAVDELTAYIKALDVPFGDKPRLYEATMDFQYFEVPTAADAGPLDDAPPAGLERRLFEVIVTGGGASNRQGLLLRDIVPLGSSARIVDHWVLGPGYTPPQKDVGLLFERDETNAPKSLKAFFEYAHAQKDARGRPLARWYAQTAYGFTPV